MRQLEEYPQHKRHEELLVDEIITKWGFVQFLCEFWELAIEDAPKDPNSHYLMLKRRFGAHGSGSLEDTVGKFRLG